MFDLSLEKPQSMAQKKVLEYHISQSQAAESEEMEDVILRKSSWFHCEAYAWLREVLFSADVIEIGTSVIDKFDDGRATIKARVM